MSNQINESKITYRKVGDYLIPNLTLPAEQLKEKNKCCGLEE